MSPMGPLTPRPDEPIQVAYPPMTSGKAEKDWRKVIENIERGKFREARKKLDEWERKHGSTPETESLRAQLENRPDMGGRDDQDD
jgi:DNA polymerase III delta prime subunit